MSKSEEETDDKFKFEVFDLNRENYKVYLDDGGITELLNLIDTCKYLINNSELVTASPAVTDKFLIKLSGWLMFISKIKAEATADRLIKTSDLFKEYRRKQFDSRIKKPEFKKMTDGACHQYAISKLESEIRNAEVFNGLYESLRELVQSLRAIVRAREITRYEKTIS